MSSSVISLSGKDINAGFGCAYISGAQVRLVDTPKLTICAYVTSAELRRIANDLLMIATEIDVAS